jgi:hypothetical protein
MILQIHDNLLISDLQEKFSKVFPCLKIEFYSKPHNIKKESSEAHKISSDKRIGDIRRNSNEGFLEIKSWVTVSQVEKDFRKQFGLNVQVFRKENGAWVMTSKTDGYTLSQQNEMSCYADHSIVPKYKEQLGEYDYL